MEEANAKSPEENKASEPRFKNQDEEEGLIPQREAPKPKFKFIMVPIDNGNWVAVKVLKTDPKKIVD